jgi:hypothetical protein
LPERKNNKGFSILARQEAQDGMIGRIQESSEENDGIG